MVQYLQNKRKQKLRRTMKVFSLSLFAGVSLGLSGYFFSPPNYSTLLYALTGFFALLAVLSLVAALFKGTASPDKSFQRDLGTIHGNESMEAAFDAEMGRPYNLQSDNAFLTDHWLIYELRKGGRRALAVKNILWVYRYDQGQTEQRHIDHDLFVMTSAQEIHEVHFNSAKSLTVFLVALHRLIPWIFYGYSKQTDRGFRQKFSVFTQEVQEARRLYLLDHPAFQSTLRPSGNPKPPEKQ